MTITDSRCEQLSKMIGDKLIMDKVRAYIYLDYFKGMRKSVLLKKYGEFNADYIEKIVKTCGCKFCNE